MDKYILSINEIFFTEDKVITNPKGIKLYLQINGTKTIWGILKCPINKKKFLIRKEIPTPQKSQLNELFCSPIVISIEEESMKIINTTGIVLDISIPEKTINFLANPT